MKKNLLLSAVMISAVVVGSGAAPQAQEPIYDEKGNLVLDELPLDTELPSQENENQAIYDKDNNLILDEPTTQQKVSDTKVQENTSFAYTRTNVTSDDTTGVMLPASATYISGNPKPISTQGTKPIKKVEIGYSVGLAEDAWKINSDNTITFNDEKLKIAHNGSYLFTITFADGTTAPFELKVMADLPFEDYWQQNIETFSKNAGSDMHRDLELTTSAQQIKILSLMVEVDERNDSGAVVIPQSAYSIVANSIIISKSYLKILANTPRARITLTYGDGLVRDFSLEITDELGNNNTSQINGCDV